MNPASNTNRTTVETASIVFCALKVYAERTGTRVIGRVEFPGDRPDVPLEYRSRRPDGSTQNVERLPDRVRLRIDCVQRFHKCCAEHPNTSPTRLAKQLAERIDGASARSIQLWAKRFELGGLEGLNDRYVEPPRGVLDLSPATAMNAVYICAWWCHRIGNADRIDQKMIAVACTLLERGYKVADIVVTIDHYYSAVADRVRFPFKPFPRWARYDFDKWLLRACETNDFRRANAEKREAHKRKREVLNRPTRAAIRALAHDPADRPPPPCDENGNPQTVAESLALLSDAFRYTLIRASQGDRDAVQQALVTWSIWFPKMPESIRRTVELKWAHHHTSPERAALDALRYVLGRLRNLPGGPSLAPAQRLMG